MQLFAAVDRANNYYLKARPLNSITKTAVFDVVQQRDLYTIRIHD